MLVPNATRLDMPDPHAAGANDESLGHGGKAHEQPDRGSTEDGSLTELLREQARRTPRAVAVAFGDATLTYAELEDRADRLGSYLRARGVGAQAPVAIALERSLDMIVAVLGVHRAGGAYVPIDPHFPDERIEFMLSDSGAVAVVTEEALRGRLSRRAPPVITIDGERAAIARASLTLTPDSVDPAHLAYVIYTSGSTGRPKGVAIELRNVRNFLDGARAAIPLGVGDTLVGLAPLVFDIAVLDIFLPLISGARLVIASREATANPKALMALLESSEATHVQATPTTWRMLIDAGWAGRAGLTIMAAGEALPRLLAEQLLARAGAVWNAYGPTEATVWATMQRLRRDEPVTIGRPMPNVTAHILDAAMAPVPPGERGELCIGGAGIARGYLNRPELTAERFMRDPFSDVPGARLYRTGDLARFLPDGQIDYLGRIDFQIKVRGHRIEPGEIETVLQERPDIRSAVVVAQPDATGDSRMIAYVIPGAGARFSSTEVRRDLATRLPAYMVPDAVVALEAFPLNANGKVDRGQLLQSRGAAYYGDKRPTLVGPRTPLEKRLVAIWEDVLDVRPLGTTDDFFELGVSSLRAARLFERIERELGAKLPLAPLYQAPTVQKLAALIEKGPGTGRLGSSLVPMQPHGSKTPVFCVHGGGGQVLHFAPLAKHLGIDQPFYGLQMRGLYGGPRSPLSVEGMARLYLKEVRSVQLEGPYVLSGYCFGGIVAFEMARQLERSGERVALLATFNGPAPAYLQRSGNNHADEDAEPEAHSAPRTAGANLAQFRPISALRRRLALRRRASGMLRSFRSAFGLPVDHARRVEAYRDICRAASAQYHPEKLPGTMLVFASAGLFSEADLGWHELMERGAEVIEIPGVHRGALGAMYEPHVQFVAARLREALERRCLIV